MLKNHIKIAWRNLTKHKVFSFINIAGLAVSLATFCLLILYVADEFSYDKFNEKADRIYRVVHRGTWNGGSFKLAPTGVPFAAALKADYPEIEESVFINPEAGGKITYNNRQFKEDRISYAGNSIFKIFSYKFLYGDPSSALGRPQTIVLTKSLATKLFGDPASALSKTIYFDTNFANTVTGVVEDVPANTHFTFDALRSLPDNFTDAWKNFYVYTYVLLKPNVDPKALEARFPQFFNKYLRSVLGDVNYHLQLQPLTSIHLHSDLDYELGAVGNIKYVYSFAAIALLILIIAIINYVNLTTARAGIRAKEVGLRKVLGSGKAKIMGLFFAETILLTVIATSIACVIADIALPYFNQLTGKSLNLLQFGIVDTLLLLIGFALIIGIVSGIYPALIMSDFKTIPAIKGQLGSQNKTVFFRKALVVFQFGITIIMIFGSLIIYCQLNYVLHKDLGFNKDQVVTFHIENQELRNNIPALRAQLLNNPLIESVGIAGNPIGNNDIGSTDLEPEINGQAGPKSLMVQILMADENFLPTLQVKLLGGRNFRPDMLTDKFHSILVNETLVKELGFKNPIGMTVIRGKDEQGQPIRNTIIGVFNDFNIASLQHQIQPLVLRMPPVNKEQDNLYVRLSKRNISGALKYLDKIYSGFSGEHDTQYHFLDQNFARQYQDEQKQSTILSVFTILAISIACLGLFGLVTFTTEQRVKEIGIRKVLGASVSSIVALIAQDFIRLIIVAFVVGVPLAWWAMHKWLQDFAYRIDIKWWYFALAGIVALSIGFITISIQSVKAALANPVNSIKNE